ncbi:MAG: adenylate cyclase, partial [Sutterella sp.]|nr:adenylate cyclase [Sutterella sp.]
EYEIPFDECTAMLDRLAEKPLIEKVRYRIPFGGFIWEIDEFEGANAGLVVAEIELPDAGTPFEKPSWAGDEVSDDPRYFNSNLVRHPYTTW